MFTQEQLSRLFLIDADGELRWRVNRFSANGKKIQARAGDVAGWTEPDGSRRVQIDGKTFPVSRIVRCLVEGVWSTDPIRHRNGHRRKISRLNTSGHPGVDWFKPLGKWRARITVDYKCINLGCFDDLAEAVSIRQAAEQEHFGEFRRQAG